MEMIERDAVISECERYRYLLRRTWDYSGQRALFVMLNPSTADANIDDPTIRSCARLCKSWGHGSFEVVNLFGWRATDPKELPKSEDPVGPRNYGIAENAINRCDVTICAWGADKMAKRRAREMHSLITSIRPVAYCLGTNKDGSPKHPLYIKTGTVLRVYQP